MLKSAKNVGVVAGEVRDPLDHLCAEDALPCITIRCRNFNHLPHGDCCPFNEFSQHLSWSFGRIVFLKYYAIATATEKRFRPGSIIAMQIRMLVTSLKICLKNPSTLCISDCYFFSLSIIKTTFQRRIILRKNSPY